MPDINQFIVSGVVRGAPEARTSQGGAGYTVLQLSVARFDARTRTEAWDELRLAVLQPEAAALAARLRDGQRVVLGGRVGTRTRPGRDGHSASTSLDLTVTSVIPGALYQPPSFTAGPGAPPPAPGLYQSPAAAPPPSSPAPPPPPYGGRPGYGQGGAR